MHGGGGGGEGGGEKRCLARPKGESQTQSKRNVEPFHAIRLKASTGGWVGGQFGTPAADGGQIALLSIVAAF